MIFQTIDRRNEDDDQEKFQTSSDAHFLPVMSCWALFFAGIWYGLDFRAPKSLSVLISRNSSPKMGFQVPKGLGLQSGLVSMVETTQ